MMMVEGGDGSSTVRGNSSLAEGGDRSMRVVVGDNGLKWLCVLHVWWWRLIEFEQKE